MESWDRELARETDRLLGFGAGVAHPGGGAAWLDDDGAAALDQPVVTYITARMAHVYAIGAVIGHAGSPAIADAMLAALRGRLRDDEHGGWVSAIAADGTVPDEKSCYAHAFVVLAAATGTVAERPGAESLLEQALRVWNERFFDPAHGMYVDSWDRAFRRLDDYRGLNANMHAVEALLAAADATGDRAWSDRALAIAARVARDLGPALDWRLPEHFTPDWTPLPDLNRDRPDDPFKPYGATVGHGLEWSRLLLHTEAVVGDDAPTWLAVAARSLFDRAVDDGWDADGAPGFVYTTDWQGRPVVHDRMHWVVAEGIAAAAALGVRFPDPRYRELSRSWWAYCRRSVIDAERGSWHHQLDRNNRPVATVWAGKPDLYHAVQATLYARLLHERDDLAWSLPRLVDPARRRPPAR